MNMPRMISGWIAAMVLGIPASAFAALDETQSDAQESKIRESVVKIPRRCAILS